MDAGFELGPLGCARAMLTAVSLERPNFKFRFRIRLVPRRVFKSLLNKGSSCSAVVVLPPHDPEVIGLNPAGLSFSSFISILALIKALIEV